MKKRQPFKALIIDDEIVVSDFLVRFLNLKGVQTKSVADGFMGIDAMRLERFDFVFLDVRMPGIDGIETLRELKKISPDAKYVVMTGYSVDNLIDEARMEGIFAAIKKPFDIREIISFVETQVTSRSNNEMSILVVDDEPDILDFFKRILARKNYVVTCVDSCQRALQEIASTNFDLIFLDILLKDGNGIELCHKILQANPALKVVFITGCSEKIRDEIKDLDVRACLFKPFEMQDIFSEIEKVSQEKEAGV